MREGSVPDANISAEVFVRAVSLFLRVDASTIRSFGWQQIVPGRNSFVLMGPGGKTYLAEISNVEGDVVDIGIYDIQFTSLGFMKMNTQTLERVARN